MKRWMNTIAGYVNGVLMFACGIVAWALCTSWFGGGSPAPGIGVLLACLLAFAALVLHELGHYAGARLAGMTVLLMNVLGVAVHPQRRGWRMSRSRQRTPGIAGYVFAAASLSRPMRPQMIAMIAGGPAANLLIAAACGIAGWFVFPGPGGHLLLACTTINAGFAAINLVPRQIPLPSDGLLLYTWLRGVDEGAPDFAATRLIARLVAGQTADELPDDELAILQSQPAQLPIVALWLRVKADQSRGDWLAAVSRADALGARVKALDPALRTAISEFLALFRMELAFSRAMLTGSGAWLENGRLTPKLLTASPWLVTRCDALKAALRGDEKGCTALLESSRRYADNSVDGSVVRGEARLRDYVSATLPGPAEPGHSVPFG